jgi:hypothetical protein
MIQTCILHMSAHGCLPAAIEGSYANTQVSKEVRAMPEEPKLHRLVRGMIHYGVPKAHGRCRDVADIKFESHFYFV